MHVQKAALPLLGFEAWGMSQLTRWDGSGMGGRQLFTGRMGVNVGAEPVVHVQNGCEGRAISEKFACLIPDLPKRNYVWKETLV